MASSSNHVEMAPSQHVELEAAKFLQKLIQESKDEPAKLATKLYVICQHMKSSGKEHSLPYQVISRAMETVINQHGLDIEVLKSSRLPLTGGPQIGDSTNARLMDKDAPDNLTPLNSSSMPFRGTPVGAWHAGSSGKAKEEVYGGPVQNVGIFKESKPGLGENEMSRHEMVNPNKPPVGPSRIGSAGHDFYQGPVSQRSGSLFEHESPSSLDTRSANSQEMLDGAKLDKQGRQKETKKAGAKRKKAGSASADAQSDNLQQLDTPNTGSKPKKGKMASKGNPQGHFTGKGGEHAHVNPVPVSAHMDHLSAVSGGMGSLFRSKQENPSLLDRSMDANPRSVWDQFKVGLPSENTQFSRFAPNIVSSGLTAEVPVPQSTVPILGTGKEAGTTGSQVKSNIYDSISQGRGRSSVAVHTNVSQGFTGNAGGSSNMHGGMPGTFSPYGMIKAGFSAPIQFNNSSFDSHELAMKMHKERGPETSSGSQLAERSKDMMSMDPAIDSEQGKPEFLKDAESSISEKGLKVHYGSAAKGEEASAPPYGGNASEQDGGTSHRLGHAYKMVQGSGSQGPQSKEKLDTGKTPMSQSPPSSGMPFREHHLKQLRAQCLVFLAFRNGLMPRKLHLDIALGDCYPKEGGDADGARGELHEPKGKEISLKEPGSNEAIGVSGRPNDINETERILHDSSSAGIPMETDSSSKDTDNSRKMKKKKGAPSDRSALSEERKLLVAVRKKPEAEMHIQQTADAQVALATTLEPESVINSGRTFSKTNHEKDDLESGQQQVGRSNQISSSVLGINQQSNPDITSLKGTGNYNDASIDTLSASMYQQESVLRRDNPLNQPQNRGYGERASNIFKSESPFVQANQRADRYPSAFSVKEQVNTISRKDVEYSNHVSNSESIISNNFGNTAFVGGVNCNPDDHRVSDIKKQCTSDGSQMVSANDIHKYENPVMALEKSAEQDEENNSIFIELSPSPNYTTSEKWIMDHQKRKLLEQQNWALKQKKTKERMSVCFDKLKKAVSSSEDISAKTKSVIELKKLQLLQLQRRLRSDFLHDFFKPITTDMERLKSIKKHRHGRRLKQLEKFEQKMKEERQKRIRERQKEFFSEIEIHKEKLEDCFKSRRERLKGFNKYVKEFHKKKERIHREKIDRIQREKINLLKNNDVEGYLRMVQDAKSDRVKQLLKETEKYLQKLGSKVQEAKSMARCFEMEMDENQAAPVVEKNEVAVDNEDERDQAEHYLESNEKYYLMAHSIKESILEQPASLQGGKLREYQMNGLRWLVSLYNNHLNGILADEMGLGKTVQVIALICYLMETKNDRGPFLVVVPSSVLSGWVSELSFWAPGIIKIAYAGPPEERRKLFKERIVQQKFNVLLTTYEYLMNKHDRPKLSKIHWHYVIIDEGHRIKNASCKLNADLKHYQSSHRLLLTGTPLQNNLEELWALLNFLLPNIFNSSEDFSQWFNKPFESGADTSPDDALLSEEENLLIINRLHQVLRPFVLRRLKHKVENELPEKIERLVRCEASAYQKLLMKRVEDNLGCIGNSKGRAVHNSVMELRNICNHPYISQLHAEQIDSLIPRHYLPPIVRLCGKLEMLDRLLPKLKATDHRVLFFSTMTRLLDVMEEYLRWKRYRYLRLDGHTSGGDRGALIEEFNRPDSPAFIFLLSIRAGGVGVNLQAADTVIIFDTDWNPQVDLQAQARAHRIGQKRDVLVLRFETVQSVEEQVRAAAEHKLGVANQSITAGFFDNHTSAEDRREYLESLLRECKKEETASVLDDDALNDLLARSESEIDTFEVVDKQRREEEMAAWQMLIQGPDGNNIVPSPPMPSRLVTDDDLKDFVKAMQIYEESNAGLKRKNEYLGGLDTQQYGRGKRAREVRSYEDQMTEEEFEKLCQADSPESPKAKEGVKDMNITDASGSEVSKGITEQLPSPSSPSQLLSSAAIPTPMPTPPISPPASVPMPAATPPIPTPAPIPTLSPTSTSTPKSTPTPAAPSPAPAPVPALSLTATLTSTAEPTSTSTPAPTPAPAPAPPQTQTQTPTPTPTPTPTSVPTAAVVPSTGNFLPRGKDQQQPPKRGRGRPKRIPPLPASSATVCKLDMVSQRTAIPTSTTTPGSDAYTSSITVEGPTGTSQHEYSVGAGPGFPTPSSGPSVSIPVKGQGRKSGSGTPRQRAKKQSSGSPAIFPQSGPGTTPASCLGLDKQKLVRASVDSNTPIVTVPIVNPISKIPTAVTIASDGSPTSTSSQDKNKVVCRQSGTTTPTIVSFEVNPISGLQKLVELVPVQLPIPSFVQEKYKSVVPVLDKKEAQKAVSSSETKPIILEGTSSARVDHIASAESKQKEGVKFKVDQTSTPTPVISALAQDLMERRTLRMGPMDALSGKKQKLDDKSEPTAVQDLQNAVHGSSAIAPAPSSSSGTVAAQSRLPVDLPVGSATQQDSLHLSNAASMSSQIIKNEKPSVLATSRRTRSSAEKDKSKVPAAAKRRPRKKDLAVGNNKQATEHSLIVSSVSHTVPGGLVGSVEAKSTGNNAEAIIRRDKGTGAKNPKRISSVKECSFSPDTIAGKPSTTVALDFPPKSIQPRQSNSAIFGEGNPACTEASKIQVPSQLKEESSSLKVGLSQTPLKSTSSEPEPTRAANVNTGVSLIKVSDSCPAESKHKGSVGTDKQETNASEPRIVHPEKAFDVHPVIISVQESKSMDKPDCLAQSKHGGFLETNEQGTEASEMRNVHSEKACDLHHDITSGHVSNLMEKSDSVPQSKQQSGSSTMLSKDTSSMNRNSPIMEADHVDVQLRLKNEGVKSEVGNSDVGSQKGGVLIAPVADKAFIVGSEVYVLETMKSVTSSSLETMSPDPKLAIVRHGNQSAEENVAKELTDRDPIESVEEDGTAPISEMNVEVKVSEADILSGSVKNLTVSEQLSQEKVLPAGPSSMQIDSPKAADEIFVLKGKGDEIPKESQQSSALDVCSEQPCATDTSRQDNSGICPTTRDCVVKPSMAGDLLYQDTGTGPTPEMDDAVKVSKSTVLSGSVANLKVSGQLSQEKILPAGSFSTLIDSLKAADDVFVVSGKGDKIPKESQQSSFVQVCSEQTSVTNLSKLDHCEADSTTRDSVAESLVPVDLLHKDPPSSETVVDYCSEIGYAELAHSQSSLERNPSKPVTKVLQEPFNQSDVKEPPTIITVSPIVPTDQDDIHHKIVVGNSGVLGFKSEPKHVATVEEVAEVGSSGGVCQVSEFSEPECVDALGQCEPPGRANTAATVSASVQIPQQDEHISDNVNISLLTDDAVGSVSSDILGKADEKADESEKFAGGMILGGTELPGLPDGASSVSSPGQVHQLDQPIPDALNVHSAEEFAIVGSDSVTYQVSEKSGEPDCVTVLGKCESSDRANTSATVSSSVQIPLNDEHIPNIPVLADNAVGSLNSDNFRKPDVSTKLEGSMLLGGMELPGLPHGDLSSCDQVLQSYELIPDPLCIHGTDTDSAGPDDLEKLDGLEKHERTTVVSHYEVSDLSNRIFIASASSHIPQLDELALSSSVTTSTSDFVGCSILGQCEAPDLPNTSPSLSVPCQKPLSDNRIPEVTIAHRTVDDSEVTMNLEEANVSDRLNNSMDSSNTKDPEYPGQLSPEKACDGDLLCNVSPEPVASQAGVALIVCSNEDMVHGNTAEAIVDHIKCTNQEGVRAPGINNNDAADDSEDHMNLEEANGTDRLNDSMNPSNTKDPENPGEMSPEEAGDCGLLSTTLPEPAASQGVVALIVSSDESKVHGYTSEVAGDDIARTNQDGTRVLGSDSNAAVGESEDPMNIEEAGDSDRLTDSMDPSTTKDPEYPGQLNPEESGDGDLLSTTLPEPAASQGVVALIVSSDEGIVHGNSSEASGGDIAPTNQEDTRVPGTDSNAAVCDSEDPMNLEDAADCSDHLTDSMDPINAKDSENSGQMNPEEAGDGDLLSNVPEPASAQSVVSLIVSSDEDKLHGNTSEANGDHIACTNQEGTGVPASDCHAAVNSEDRMDLEDADGSDRLNDSMDPSNTEDPEYPGQMNPEEATAPEPAAASSVVSFITSSDEDKLHGNTSEATEGHIACTNQEGTGVPGTGSHCAANSDDRMNREDADGSDRLNDSMDPSNTEYPEYPVPLNPENVGDGDILSIALPEPVAAQGVVALIVCSNEDKVHENTAEAMVDHITCTNQEGAKAPGTDNNAAVDDSEEDPMNLEEANGSNRLNDCMDPSNTKDPENPGETSPEEAGDGDLLSTTIPEPVAAQGVVALIVCSNEDKVHENTAEAMVDHITCANQEGAKAPGTDNNAAVDDSEEDPMNLEEANGSNRLNDSMDPSNIKDPENPGETSPEEAGDGDLLSTTIPEPAASQGVVALIVSSDESKVHGNTSEAAGEDIARTNQEGTRVPGSVGDSEDPLNLEDADDSDRLTDSMDPSNTKDPEYPGTLHQLNPEEAGDGDPLSTALPEPAASQGVVALIVSSDEGKVHGNTSEASGDDIARTNQEDTRVPGTDINAVVCDSEDPMNLEDAADGSDQLTGSMDSINAKDSENSGQMNSEEAGDGDLLSTALPEPAASQGGVVLIVSSNESKVHGNTLEVSEDDIAPTNQEGTRVPGSDNNAAVGDSEDPLNLEDADDSDRLTDSMDPSTTKYPECPGQLNPEEAGDGDLLSTTLPEPAASQGVAALIVSSDKVKVHGNTSEAAGDGFACTNQEGTRVPETDGNATDLSSIATADLLSCQDASCDGKKIEEPCVRSEDKETSVLETVLSVVAEPCNSEPRPEDLCEVQSSALVESSKDDNDERPCSSESRAESLCEVQPSALVESIKDDSDENQSPARHLPKTELSPQQVLADLSEDHKDEETPSASDSMKENQTDVMETDDAEVARNVISNPSSAVEEDEKMDDIISEKAPTESSGPTCPGNQAE